MSLRDTVIFLTVFCLLPFCIARPYVALLTWSWLSYMNPHKMAWGAAYNFPFAQIVAITMVVAIVLSAIRQKRMPKIPWERETVLLTMLWATFLATTFFALRPDLAWPELREVSKIILAAFFTLVLIDDERKVKYMFYVIAFSLGFFGLKGGVFSILTGGQSTIYGPGGFIAGNNSIGLALNMVLPILYFLARIEKNPWIRRLLYLTFFMSIVAIMFTYSRGAVVGLVAVLGLIALTLRFRAKVLIALLVMLTIPVTISMLPDKFVDRMATVQTYEEDGSAMKRLAAWKTAWLVALNRPLVGGGFQIINDPEIGARYNPEFTARDVGAHSIYFEVIGENGFVAFALFIGLLLSCRSSLRKVQRESLNTDHENLYYYAKMIEIGLAGYAVSGIFLEMAKYDMLYQFVALTVVLKKLSNEYLAAARHAEADDTPASFLRNERVPLA